MRLPKIDFWFLINTQKEKKKTYNKLKNMYFHWTITLVSIY